jgi:prephenate dehydrogenase
MINSNKSLLMNAAPSEDYPQQSLGLIGVGAFGGLAARHLAPHFELVLHDAGTDSAAIAQEIGARVGDLRVASACDIVMLAVPVQKMRTALADIAPLLRPGALVLDVASVKIKPVAAMVELLPPSVSIVGTHPLFGPQSGKDSIAGLNIAVCDIRGGRGAAVSRFCAGKLGLKVFNVTPEEHDRELAYVHGLTHMLGKVIVSLDLPKFRMTTKTYELIDQAVEFIRYDSDELFHAIERENPFSGEAKQAFFAAARKLEGKLAGD